MSYQDRMIELMRQRERLLVRSAVQRAELMALAQRWERPLRIADRALECVGYLRRHALAAGALAGLLAITGRRGVWGWTQRGFVLWRGYLAFRKFVA
jgi:hypothetical protein